MSVDLLAEVMQALELFGMERRPDSSIVAISPPPPWLTPILEAAGDTPFSLAQAFPFLDDFMREAEAMWHDGAASRVVSGAFTAAAGADQLLLRASALALGNRSVLVLERLHGDADARPLLQRARENKLESERLVRQVDALKTTLATAARLAEALLDTELPLKQRELAERISRTVSQPSGDVPPSTRPG
jgi:hypothetical protein